MNIFSPDFLKGHKTLGRMFKGAFPFVVAECFEFHSDHMLVVGVDDHELSVLKKSLAYIMPSIKVHHFLAWDCVPYDRISPRREVMGERLAVLDSLLNDSSPQIVLTTPSALMQKLLPSDVLKNMRRHLKVQDTLDMGELCTFLSSCGFLRTSVVHETGEFALRGSIVDIYPPGHETPYRMDFFGDTLESIKTFDPLTQRTLTQVEDVVLSVGDEVILNPETIELFRRHYRAHRSRDLLKDPLYTNISEGKPVLGQEHFLPLFYEKLETLFEYMKSPTIIELPEASEAMMHRWDMIEEHYQERLKFKDSSFEGQWVYDPLNPMTLYISPPEVETGMSQSKTVIILERFDSGPQTDCPTLSQPILPLGLESFKDLVASGAYHKKSLHLMGLDSTQIKHVEGLLEPYNLPLHPVQQIENLSSSHFKKGHGYLHEAFWIGGLETPDTTILTAQDLFGEAKKGSRKKVRNSDLFAAQASVPEIGTFLVHEDHGIGRFEGLVTLDISGHSHDFFKLVYDGDAKLFVPVENSDVLSRYGGMSDSAVLDKLGGVGWYARKEKVKKRLEDMAEQLILLATERYLKKADTFDSQYTDYENFVKGFAFVETEDQQNAIDATLQDLEAGKPMDRLICGDVGFGKTEIALRAAYVVASHGKQVAIITPTTLLCRQHALNFERRFKEFPLKVAQLSRFVTGKKAKEVHAGLENGDVKVVVGTHSLLAKGMKFANLGLVIVDEEQHFGVKQKEYLKNLKQDVHVLTLTATPIPRTLQLSLTGVRDLSVIATPPVDRLAIQTTITPFDPLVIKEAITRELHRGGQIFYVAPRIKDLKDVQAKLEKLMPDVAVAVAHGQLAPHDLEKIMDDFMDQKYQILLATNIIESGIDLPTVNTMIIHRADLFGLAQLYQLRGRIGRGKIRAYAYLTIPGEITLNSKAIRRLEVMQTLDHLGAGFQLASYDMDIRGAGNLLGAEQSGHIKEVGVELYQTLLEESVSRAKSMQQGHTPTSLEEHGWSPQIHCNLSVLIPQDYIQDMSMRLELYQRLAKLQGAEEIDEFAAEMTDRFGPYPQEVANLLSIIKLKNKARQAYIERIDVADKGILIGFYQNKFPNVENLLGWIAAQKGHVKLRSDQKIFVSLGILEGENFITPVEKVLEDIHALL